jgi:peptide-methionine (S)-S-oxide reductase
MSKRLIFFMLVSYLLTGFNVNAAKQADHELATATFSGGCFWCMEQPFDMLPGVIKTISGYTGGDTKNPTYKRFQVG